MEYNNILGYPRHRFEHFVFSVTYSQILTLNLHGLDLSSYQTSEPQAGCSWKGHQEWRSCSPTPWSGRPSYSLLPWAMFQLLLVLGAFRAPLCKCRESATAPSPWLVKKRLLVFTCALVCAHHWLLYVTSLQIFVHTFKFLPPPLRLLFSRLKSQFSVFSRRKSPLNISPALCWTCCSMATSLLYLGVRNRTRHSRSDIINAEGRGRIPALHLPAALLLMQLRTPSTFFFTKANCRCLFHSVPTGTPSLLLQSCSRDTLSGKNFFWWRIKPPKENSHKWSA